MTIHCPDGCQEGLSLLPVARGPEAGGLQERHVVTLPGATLQICRTPLLSARVVTRFPAYGPALATCPSGRSPQGIAPRARDRLATVQAAFGRSRDVSDGSAE